MGPPTFSATIEGSNFKFGTQLGFGKYVTITALSLVPNLVVAGNVHVKSRFVQLFFYKRCVQK